MTTNYMQPLTSQDYYAGFRQHPMSTPATDQRRAAIDRTQFEATNPGNHWPGAGPMQPFQPAQAPQTTTNVPTPLSPAPMASTAPPITPTPSPVATTNPGPLDQIQTQNPAPPANITGGEEQPVQPNSVQPNNIQQSTSDAGFSQHNYGIPDFGQNFEAGQYGAGIQSMLGQIFGGGFGNWGDQGWNWWGQGQGQGQSQFPGLSGTQQQGQFSGLGSLFEGGY